MKWICSSIETPLFGVSHSHDVKAGTGDALEAISAHRRKKRSLSSNVALDATKSRGRLTTYTQTIAYVSKKTADFNRKKRQSNEFPQQVEPIGDNNSNMSKLKNVFNKVVDAFDDLVGKIQKLVKSAETDGTVSTRAK